jgi:hypothetical protein
MAASHAARIAMSVIRRNRRTMLAGLLAVWSILAPSVSGQTVAEEEVKATFLWRFPSFTAWPASHSPNAGAPLTICVVGARNFADTMRRTGRSEGQKNVRLLDLDGVDPSTGCHVVFAGSEGSQSISDVLAAVETLPVLTVTDERHGSTRGAIHFETRAQRVRFHVDLGQAERRGVRLNSRLLGVAVTVTPSQGTGQ